ncbi:hydrogen gas-evolving membrane-bound hydrogenase subunit E [Pseudokineococcus lusitanus]|uniref:Multisubunit sodium/proton antiporter MrpA subunit /multisubunit sodium/proton antiporter MrpB subunit n=1 Tax=Pseudokineococcus lusitanus TaxID=763993 RepID=A0A3N1HK82_9ACTN|nr:hydrogen gas-evolving membrane-bound hydrogenase subunit E [Pseudokineococcus lusitanus]ROP42865.1 multisubunit sodium/proton antiporter MrpA subunit /multisubunit sodium/proton antiporter MrpB subunit [Pseudokineococcus lusitanus]
MALVVVLGGLLVLAAAAPLLGRALGREAAYVLAGGTAACAAVVVALAPPVLRGGAVVASWQWLPGLDVAASLRLDGVSLVFVLVALVVGALVLAYCARYLDDEQARGPVLPLLVVFAAAMCGLVLADDLVLLYVCWELTTVCSFFLVQTAGARGEGPGRQALVVTVAGGLALLVAVVLVVVATGTTDLGALLADPTALTSSPLLGPVAVLVAVAAMTKSAQVPFQFWLPGAMVAMTPVSAYLHAATMVKAGIYLLVRTSPFFADRPAWTAALLAVGLTTALVGAVLALREHDLKGVLAWSTVSQLGLLVAAVGVGTPTALAAALLHTGAHALFKATLFMLVGIVDHETGGRDVRDLSGLRKVMPRTAAATAVAALSMAGVPPLLGFVSKEYLYQGFLSTGEGSGLPTWVGWVAGAAAVAASALTFAYAMRIVHGAFGGGEVSHPGLHEPAGLFLAPAAVAATAGLLLGPAVSVLDPVVAAATADALPGATAPEVYFWHGLSPEVVMSLVTLAVGLTLFLRRDAVDRVLQRWSPPSAAGAFDAAHAGLLRLGARAGGPDRAAGDAGHLARPLLALLAVAVPAAVVLTGGDDLAPRATSGDPGAWVVVALVGAAVVAAATTASALVLVALVGLVGLLVAVWLLLQGALDVAITLLLVEVLTAVVLVLVLRGEPRHLPVGADRRAGRLRRTGVVALGAATGLAAGGAAWALTGRSPLSPVGATVLAEAEELTGGTNAVNVVLVDFRGLDTFFESVLVGVVAVGLVVLGRGPAGRRAGPTGPDPATDDLVLRTGTRLLVPLMLVLSAYLLWRGHDEPGGGFVAALVTGTAVALGHLAGGRAPFARTPRLLRPSTLAGTGLLVSLLTGVAPLLVGGALLQPYDVPVLGAVGVSSALLFEVGVFLIVLALVVAAVHTLDAGTAPTPGTRVGAPRAATTAPSPAAPGRGTTTGGRR